MKTAALLSLLLCASALAAHAQNYTDPNASRLLLNQTPAGCTVGQTLLRTDLFAGSNYFLCATPNTWTQIGGSSGGSVTWTKYLITISGTNWMVNGISAGALTPTASTQQISLATAAARQVFHGLVLKHSIAFAGTSITDVTCSVGTAGTPDQLMIVSGDTFDLFQAVSTTTFYATGGLKILSFASTGVVLQINTTGNNINGLSAGALEVDVLTSSLP
jgi:hypothetical protein